MDTTQTITEEAWRQQYQPHEDAQQTYGVVNYGYQTEAEIQVLEQAQAEGRLWTYCLSAVGNAYIAQGWAYVNREFYIITAAPAPAGLEIDMGPPAFCEYCGEWFVDQNDSYEGVTRSTTDPLTCVPCLTGDERDCASGIHSWVGEVGQLPTDTRCTSCGESYGEGV